MTDTTSAPHTATVPTVAAAPAAPTAPATRPPTGVLARGAALAVAAGLAVNAVVFAAGAAGAPIRVVTGAAPDGTDLTYGAVALSTVLLSLLGSGALWLFERARPGSARAWAGLAAAVGVLSIPPVLRLDIDAGSKLSLAVMHLAVAATTIGAHALLLRRHRTA
jgi:Family of unknown function (DUF6069)